MQISLIYHGDYPMEFVLVPLFWTYNNTIQENSQQLYILDWTLLISISLSDYSLKQTETWELVRTVLALVMNGSGDRLHQTDSSNDKEPTCVTLISWRSLLFFIPYEIIFNKHYHSEQYNSFYLPRHIAQIIYFQKFFKFFIKKVPKN